MTSTHRDYALITGSGSGIGYELALGFAAKGYTVIATDVNLDAMKELETQLQLQQANFQCYSLDVTNASQWQALRETLTGQGIIPDILVNNAGVGYFANLLETPPKMIDRVLDINIKGVIYGYQTFVPCMRESNKLCHIVNVASGASKTPMPNMAVYAASKSAVEGLTDVMAMELDNTRIQLMCVHPGIINTPIVQNRSTIGASISNAQMQRLQHHYVTKGCPPRQVARDIIDGIKKRKRVVYTGPGSLLSATMSRLLSKAMLGKALIKTARKVGYL